MRMVVVLPLPFGPKNPHTLPFLTLMSMPSVMTFLPNFLVRPLTLMA